MENIVSKSKTSFAKRFYSDLLELSDGKLHTEDGTSFQIHKIELVRNSDYFYRLFCNAAGKGKSDFLIPGISGEVLGNILSFIYSEKVTVTDSNVSELLIAADYLLLEDLIMSIKNVYVRKDLGTTSCLPLFFSALQIDRKDILQECFRYILTHFESVAADGFELITQLPQNVLEQFLSNRSLCVQDEVPVWTTIRKWVGADIENRQQLLPGLLKCLAVPDISQDLANQILSSPVVAHNPFCRELFKANECYQSGRSLDSLRSYILRQRSPGSFACYGRLPSHIYFVAHYCVHNQTDGIHIYTTYDEEIDLWRKLVEVDVCPDFIFAVGHDIFLFVTSEGKSMRYSLLNKEWEALPELITQRNFYSAVHLDGLVYVIGGISAVSEEEMNDVEVYSRVEDEWHDVAPMMPVTSFYSVTIGRKIYVVGNTPSFLTFDMVAQVYSVEADTWTFLQSPSIFRFNFTLVAYKEQLYILGGRNNHEYLKNVEVFDPERQEWFDQTPMPYYFYLPKAIVLNERLIVYDNHLEDRTYLKTNPALMWDDQQKHWKPFEESSPMNAVHKYCFFCPDNEECKNRIARENKDPQNEFVKSQFA